MIIALAGRRIDPEGANYSRFPLKNCDLVRQRIKERFETRRASGLVASGAAGADLLAHDVARELRLPRRMVLPFSPDRFREASVTNRPGNWGPLFDRTVKEMKTEGGLIVLDGAGDGDEAYQAVNRRIIEEAKAHVSAGADPASSCLAAVVWEGTTRGNGDLTVQFAEEARTGRLPLTEIFTDFYRREPAQGVLGKLNRRGPRRLLSLDGGGIRGLISIEVLARIEAMLRERADASPDFVLADYFDYIGGTSTGAIIATCLALGWSVDKIRKFYRDSGQKMFQRAGLLKRIYYKFSGERLKVTLQKYIGKDTTLGADALRTLLLIVLRNASTDSPWPLSNNPAAKFNQSEQQWCNLRLPLWELVRASTAAPMYFPPEEISVGPESFVFVDGGVTMYNNPAFQLFLMATVEPYNLCWPSGQDQMLIVSVGTGSVAAENRRLRPIWMNILFNLFSVPTALMAAAKCEQDFLCRVFGRCLVGNTIDLEVGDMIGQRGPVDPKLFTYLRYNCDLSHAGFNYLGIDPSVRPEDVRHLDATSHMEALRAIGEAVGKRQVQEGHFFGFGR